MHKLNENEEKEEGEEEKNTIDGGLIELKTEIKEKMK